VRVYAGTLLSIVVEHDYTGEVDMEPKQQRGGGKRQCTGDADGRVPEEDLRVADEGQSTVAQVRVVGVPHSPARVQRVGNHATHKARTLHEEGHVEGRRDARRAVVSCVAERVGHKGRGERKRERVLTMTMGNTKYCSTQVTRKEQKKALLCTSKAKSHSTSCSIVLP